MRKWNSVFKNFEDREFRLVVEHFFKEKTFDIDVDVDELYLHLVKLFKRMVDGEPLPLSISFTSSILRSKESKAAHKKNPVSISIYIGDDVSNYSPLNKKITIVPNYEAVKEVIKTKKLATKEIALEFSADMLKAIISHELSHWIQDSLYNNYLTNLISRASNIDRQNDPKAFEKINKILQGKKFNINQTFFELDAQIHGIKQIYRNHRDSWDSMHTEELFLRYTSLFQIALDLIDIDKNVYKLWMKDLLRRMHRESILGKNMKIPSIAFFSNKHFESITRL